MALPILNQILLDDQAEVAAIGPAASDRAKIIAMLAAIEAQMASDKAEILSHIASDETDVMMALASAEVMLQQIIDLEQQILGLLGPAPDTSPVSAHAALTQTFDFDTGKERPMPQSILNDVISGFTVEFDNVAGQPVSPPAGGSVTVSLVDGTGAPSPLGTVAVGWPDGSGMDGSKFMITPASPKGSATGNATVKYDDTSTNAGGPNDISFTLDVTFGNDTQAVSAKPGATVTTFPMP